MFYCEGCAARKGWPHYGYGSLGPCEVCGKRAVCADVPSKYLPIPTPPVEPEPVAAPVPTEIEQLAIWMHLDMCTKDHHLNSTRCTWLDERDDRTNIHNWSCTAHARYLAKAGRLVERTGSLALALDAFNIYRTVRNA